MHITIRNTGTGNRNAQDFVDALAAFVNDHTFHDAGVDLDAPLSADEASLWVRVDDQNDPEDADTAGDLQMVLVNLATAAGFETHDTPAL